MKKLITYADGSQMPFWQTDLGFIQAATEEVLTELVKGLALTEDTIIVSGCELMASEGSYSIAKGLVLIDNEILVCPAQTVESAHSYAVLRKQTLTDSAGRKIFILADSNTETRETHDVSYAKLHLIEESATIPADLPVDSDNVIAKISESILPTLEWGNLTLMNGYTTTGIAKFKKSGDVISLRGEVFNDAQQCGNEFAILPASCRPTTDIEIGDILIKANGQVKDTSCATRKIIDCIYMI